MQDYGAPSQCPCSPGWCHRVRLPLEIQGPSTNCQARAPLACDPGATFDLPSFIGKGHRVILLTRGLLNASERLARAVVLSFLMLFFDGPSLCCTSVERTENGFAVTSLTPDLLAAGTRALAVPGMNHCITPRCTMRVSVGSTKAGGYERQQGVRCGPIATGNTFIGHTLCAHSSWTCT